MYAIKKNFLKAIKLDSTYVMELSFNNVKYILSKLKSKYFGYDVLGFQMKFF